MTRFLQLQHELIRHYTPCSDQIPIGLVESEGYKREQFGRLWPTDYPVAG